MKKINIRLFLLIIPWLCLLTLSLMALYKIYNLNILFYKQILWILIAFLLILIIAKINFNKLFKLAWVFYLFNLILLILVLFLDKSSHGAKAWLNFGLFSYQPSEFMKISLSLYLPYLISITKIKNFQDEFLLIIKFALITILPAILVFLEPDTGAIIFYGIICLTILFASNIKKGWFIVLGISLFIIFFIFTYLYTFNNDLLINILGTSIFYRIDRLIKFKTNTSYQLNNALTVIGSAKFINFNSLNNLYIPEATTDFIYAYLIGKYGLVLAFMIPFLYILIFTYLIYLYNKVKDTKIKLFLISFINIFIFNVFVNISMNLGLIPIIGIPLPFISYGGSAMISYSIYLGLIFKISKYKINNT